MNIRSVDERHKIMTDLTPNDPTNKTVAELDPPARTIYTKLSWALRRQTLRSLTANAMDH